MQAEEDNNMTHNTVQITINPPYQDETLGDNKGYAPPIYDKFLGSSFDITEVVELIHPARFLLNAGSTSKD